MTPLISCICITQNRRLFLRRAIEYYMSAEKYSGLECELIIVDGSEHFNIDAPYFCDEDIHYFHLPCEPHTKMGWFHNEAIERTKGEFIIKWDDDDWQSSERILKQLAALRNLQCDARGLAFTSQYFGYSLTERKAFRSRCWDTPKSGTMGGAMAFHRSVWEQVPFQDVDQGEDSVFFDDCVKKGIPLCDMLDSSYYVYIRHNQNASADSNQNYSEVATEEVQILLSHPCYVNSNMTDMDFYNELSEILPLSQRASPKTFGQFNPYVAKSLFRR